MNHCKASCGHSVVAVGAPGSNARLACERGKCDECKQVRVGDRVRSWSSFFAVWTIGTVIGTHVDIHGINPSGLDMATVRFDESAGTGVTDVALAMHKLERIVE
jgi:hypothetical protein